MSIQRAEADLAALDAKVSNLRAQLHEAEIRATKLRTYIEVSREYGVVSAEPRSAEPVHGQNKPKSERGVTEAAVETSIEMLEDRGSPIHTRDLLQMLADRGIQVRGANPVANLSGFLSREKERLRNSRTTGWSLRKWEIATADSGECGSDARSVNENASEHAANTNGDAHANSH